jgi:predicted RNase H-like HicB family nuclease
MHKVETEQEVDGWWIAEVPELSGVLAYGQSRDEAVRNAQALSPHMLADRLEQPQIPTTCGRLPNRPVASKLDGARAGSRPARLRDGAGCEGRRDAEASVIPK